MPDSLEYVATYGSLENIQEGMERRNDKDGVEHRYTTRRTEDGRVKLYVIKQGED